MTILLFGKNGQVGWELQRSLSPLGDIVALDSRSKDLCGDFTDPEGLAETVRKVKPRIIVNAAAHTAVDRAQSEPGLARTINADAPAVLAREAKALDTWLVHYSTDYVFDGSGNRPWKEDDAPGPLSVYGITKLQGEQEVQESGCKHLIFRTSWVYAARGANFAKTMLRLARERAALKVIDDQVGAPTAAELLADVTAHALRAALERPEVAGLYHLAAAGETSWHGYARFVIDEAVRAGMELKALPEAIEPIPTSAYPLPAPRPANSRLDTQKLRTTFNLHLPHWQSGVTRMISEILEKQT